MFFFLCQDGRNSKFVENIFTVQILIVFNEEDLENSLRICLCEG
jgi:hypothetical protein